MVSHAASVQSASEQSDAASTGIESGVQVSSEHSAAEQDEDDSDPAWIEIGESVEDWECGVTA